jgi:hypothetical protein
VQQDKRGTFSGFDIAEFALGFHVRAHDVQRSLSLKDRKIGHIRCFCVPFNQQPSVHLGLFISPTFSHRLFFQCLLGFS